MSKSTSKFPTPYVNSINETDSYVIRVNQDNGDIGSRPSSAPSFESNSRMTIEHVGNNATGKK
jgi:hypothetical protein